MQSRTLNGHKSPHNGQLKTRKPQILFPMSSLGLMEFTLDRRPKHKRMKHCLHQTCSKNREPFNYKGSHMTQTKGTEPWRVHLKISHARIYPWFSQPSKTIENESHTQHHVNAKKYVWFLCFRDAHYQCCKPGTFLFLHDVAAWLSDGKANLYSHQRHQVQCEFVHWGWRCSLTSCSRQRQKAQLLPLNKGSSRSSKSGSVERQPLRFVSPSLELSRSSKSCSQRRPCPGCVWPNLELWSSSESCSHRRHTFQFLPQNPGLARQRRATKAMFPMRVTEGGMVTPRTRSPGKHRGLHREHHLEGAPVPLMLTITWSCLGIARLCFKDARLMHLTAPACTLAPSGIQAEMAVSSSSSFLWDHHVKGNVSRFKMRKKNTKLYAAMST